MRRVIISGGPGAGKTTLLAEFARSGFETASDSARAVIAERVARGETPRPDPKTFALELLRRDDEKYRVTRQGAQLVFFDRSAVESLAMVHEVAPLVDAALKEKLAAYRFHRTVFVLPPWESIYRTDAERDHSFAHAERVHSQLVRWYRWCGYAINVVPRLEVVQRAKFVLHALSVGDA